MLKQQAIHGVKWSMVSTGANSALNFAQTVLLARLLSPSDFGIMGMCMLIVNFSQMLSDAGVSNAIIYRQDASREHLSTLYWLNVGVSGVVFILLTVSARFFAELFKTPDLYGILMWISVVVLIAPFGQQFGILLQKELRFDLLALASISGHLANCALAIVLAMSGLGVYALVFGYVANIFIRTLILVVSCWGQWRPDFRFSLKDVKAYLTFGYFQVGDRTIGYLTTNMAKIFLATLLGARELGYYTLAYDHVFKPMTVLNAIVNRVAFPMFSKLQNDRPRVRRAYMKVLHVLSSFNAPLALGIGATAGVAVPVFYGSQWEPAIVLVQIFAVAAFIQYLNSPLGSLLLAHGKANWLFNWNLGKIAVIIPGMFVGVKLGGMVGAAATIAVLQCVYVSFAYPLLLRRLLGPCLREQITSVRSPTVMGAILFGILLLSSALLGSLSKPFLLMVQIGIGLGFCSIFMAIMQKGLLTELRELRFSSRGES